MSITKRTIIISVSGFVTLVVIIGGGLWWHTHQQHTKRLSSTNKTSDTTADSGGLNVSGGGAFDLGQLGGNGKNQAKDGSSNSGGSGGSSDSGGGLDPSTFTQYNKYQTNKDALFGDIQKGSGASLTNGKQANVYYKGWLTNGALIDQSPVSTGGQPQAFNFTMGAHQVIPGWEEGLYGMQAGGTRLIIVPPAVGYGAQAHGTVPANAVLVFEVQLVSVQ